MIFLRILGRNRLLYIWTIILCSLLSVTSANDGFVNGTVGVQFHTKDTSVGRMTFAAEPTGRGTWRILFSCTATFVFCVWTAVHPDVLPGATRRDRFIYKAILTVVAFVNPEGITILAFGQWRDARKIQKEWRLHFKKLQYDLNIHDPETWRPLDLDLKTAFFIVMGGFVIDESKVGSDKNHVESEVYKLARTESRLALDRKLVSAREDEQRFTATLTPCGFVEYLKKGAFDNLLEMPFHTAHGEEIDDKSNANHAAKILSSLQALWLIVQSIQRAIVGLPLTYVYNII